MRITLYKGIVLFALNLLFMSGLVAQDYSNLDKIDISDAASCKAAQPKVMECADFLLSTACQENLNSLNAMVFLIRWMGATPDYMFGLNDAFYKTIKSNDLLTGRYYAALAKTAIEEEINEDNLQLQLKAITLFLEYCETPEHQVTIRKKLNKYIDAKSNGSLPDLISGD